MKTYLLVLSLVFVFPFVSQAKIKRFAQIENGLYRGAMIDSEEDYQYLKDIGVKTIVNLQTTQERIERDQEYGKKYRIRVISIPIPSIVFSPRERDVNHVLAAMANPGLRPLYVHCTHGRDRTGMVTALHRVKENGWTADQAYNEWVAMEFDDNLFTGTLSNYYWEHVGDM